MWPSPPSFFLQLPPSFPCTILHPCPPACAYTSDQCCRSQGSVLPRAPLLESEGCISENGDHGDHPSFRAERRLAMKPSPSYRRAQVRTGVAVWARLQRPLKNQVTRCKEVQDEGEKRIRGGDVAVASLVSGLTSSWPLSSRASWLLPSSSPWELHPLSIDEFRSWSCFI